MKLGPGARQQADGAIRSYSSTVQRCARRAAPRGSVVSIVIFLARF